MTDTKISIATLTTPLATDWLPIARGSDTTARRATLQGVLNLHDDIINAKTQYGATGDGVTDDTTAINNAIAALNATTGGVVYLPTGTYITTKEIGIINRHNVTLCGDGIDLTIIDSSATESIGYDTQSVTEIHGTIGIFTTTSAGLQNITVRDLTVKASVTGTIEDFPSALWYRKNIYVGSVIDCTLERVKCVGGKYEVIYHQEDNITVADGWKIVNCEVTGHAGGNAINSNNPTLANFLVTGCYIHDAAYDGTHSGTGIYMSGKNGIISNNIIENVRYYGIYVENETSTYVAQQENIIVSNNVIDGVKRYQSAANSCYGIYLRTQYDTGDSVICANNMIANIYQETSGSSAYGILTAGGSLIDGNYIRRIKTDSGIGFGISCQRESGDGGTYKNNIKITNNLLASDEDDDWRPDFGIHVQPTPNHPEGKVIISGNIIDDYAIKQSGSYQFALYESGGNTTVIMSDCYMGKGKVFYGGVVDTSDLYKFVSST